MRFSQLLIPTLKENPADAEVVSHQLLTRAGFIRKLTAGVYSYLPLALRSIRKVERIVREEMERAGAQELLLPMVQPADLWKETRRWEKYGPELLRFRDRHDRESCLGPTHEEVITDLVRMNVHSYRNLPLNLFQIQTKFRDEIRPRFGLMRGREFIMKDGYSFDASEEGAAETYGRMYDAYQRIFGRCGLGFRAVEADTGTIGGNFSHEFMVLADTGEDTLVICSGCDYAANMEKATCRPPAGAGTEADLLPPEKVATPGRRTVDEVTDFLGIGRGDLVKTLVYRADGRYVAVLVRGDHEVQPVKLKNILGADEVEMAGDEEVQRATGVAVGFLGPVGCVLPIYADLEVARLRNFVTGANEADHHLRNVNFGRDFEVAASGDLRTITEEDHCPRCGGRLGLTRGIEVGHIFRLGTAYSEKMAARFLDGQGRESLFVMGCYGIGVSRTVAAAIEQNHDDDGIIFPMPIAPFQVILLNLGLKDETICRAAAELYAGLNDAGIEVLLDDRDERPGIKFKDADLLGIPLRVMIGKRFSQDGCIEIRDRKSGEVSVVAAADAVTAIADLVCAAMTATGGQ
ncbi:MAG: proline--tRNA ligase [Thermodesulfobacteriota bacterium]